MIKAGASYFGNRFLNHFRNDLLEFQSLPFHYIVHTFSENDLRFYKQTMQDFVLASKQAGMEVYMDPWGVGGLFGGEAFSEFAAKWPQECQVLSTGEMIPAACPGRESFFEFMCEWTDAACGLGADVIFWDEPHFYLNGAEVRKNPFGYDKWACCCDVCQKNFKSKYGTAMGTRLDEKIIEYRQDILKTFLEKLCRRVKSKGLKNAVCLLPVPSEKFAKILGIYDWAVIAAINEIDILSTDPYWALLGQSVKSYVRSFSEKLIQLSKQFGKESEIWIQGFKIQKNREKEVAEAIETVKSCRPDRMAVWSYKATECMSELSCENPTKIWDILKNGFRQD
jgi:hypothetical protein